MTCLPVKGLRHFKIFQRRPPPGAGARNVLYGGGHSRAQMDRRGTVAVAALALLLVVSTAGCVEVKDRPERGEFTITLEIPPLIMVNTTGGLLHGPEAELTTDLESKDIEYYWGIESLAGGFPPTFDEWKGRDLQFKGAHPGLQRIQYGVEYYGQRRNLTLFLASIPADQNATIVVADVNYLNTSYVPEGSTSPKLAVDSMAGNLLAEDGRIATIYNFTPEDRDNASVEVFFFYGLSGNNTYLVACRQGGLPGTAPVEAALIYRPYEDHVIDLDPSGGMNVTIWDTHYGNSKWNFTWKKLYNGSVSGLPRDRRVEPGMLVWNGTVGGGKEESPGTGALLAVASIAAAASAMAMHRRRSHLTRAA